MAKQAARLQTKLAARSQRATLERASIMKQIRAARKAGDTKRVKSLTAIVRKGDAARKADKAKIKGQIKRASKSATGARSGKNASSTSGS